MRNEISVIIQGPIDDRTYEAIDQYQDFSKVIVSTWEDQDIDLLRKATGAFEVAISKYPPLEVSITYCQAATTFAGCLLAETDYVMKTRSDELYPDLDAILNNLKDHPDRSHTTNNGFWKQFPHCYSNHLFIDRREYVMDAMKELAEYHLNNDNYLNFAAAESEFGYFLMKQRGIILNNENWREKLSKNVYITPCVHLKGHLHSGATTHHAGFSRSDLPYPQGRTEVGEGKHDEKKLYHSHEDIA